MAADEERKETHEAKGKRPYMRPSLTSSDAFERMAASCAGTVAGNLSAVKQPGFTNCASNLQS